MLGSGDRKWWKEVLSLQAPSAGSKDGHRTHNHKRSLQLQINWKFGNSHEVIIVQNDSDRKTWIPFLKPFSEKWPLSLGKLKRTKTRNYLVLKRASASTNCPWHSHRESPEPDTSLTGNNQLVKPGNKPPEKNWVHSLGFWGGFLFLFLFLSFVLFFLFCFVFKASQEKGKNKVKSPKERAAQAKSQS